MNEIYKSGRIFSICKCTIGKDWSLDKDEIAACQKEQPCYEKWDKYCYHYRTTCGHCDRVENDSSNMALEVITQFGL